MGFQISQRIDNYLRYRPRYPSAVLDVLKQECSLSPRQVVADVGSGTGLLSELFLRNGNSVFGIEPDPDMRRGGEQYLRGFSNFTSIAGTAEDTTLEAGSVDVITAGQSFHWFDLPSARIEFGRVLRPEGWVVIVWNVQRTRGTPFLEDLQEFWEREEFAKKGTRPSPAARQALRRYRQDFDAARAELLDPFFGPGRYTDRVFHNPMPCELEALKGRVLSNAHALEPGDPLYPSMLGALEDLFRKHQVGGRVTIEHDTRMVYAQFDPP